MTIETIFEERPEPLKPAPKMTWLAIALACLADFALCLGLINSNYFNDDLEQLADGAFWKSVYVTQLDVHMPLAAMISAAVSSVFGASWRLNRILAAAYHLPVCAIIVLWMTRLFPGKRGVFAGLAASLVWSLSHVHDWAYLDLTEVPTTMFLVLGLYFGLDLQDSQIKVKRPLLLGALFGCAGLTRIMNGLQILLLMGAVLAVAKGAAKERLVALAKICVGGLLPVIAMSLYFLVDGRLHDVFFFALAHNFEAKSGNFNPMAWVGNLAAPDIRASYALMGLALILGLRAAVSPAARLALIMAAGAIGGWLSANPTGIGDVAFHAIPAFPFFAILVGLGLGAMLSARRPQGDPLGALPVMAFNLALLAGVAVWGTAAVRGYQVWHKGRNALELKLRAQRVGAFIQAHTPVGSRIFVFGADPQVYVTSKRDSASMASFLYNEMTEYKDKIFRQVQSGPPSAIFMPSKDFWHDQDMAAFPELAAYFLAAYGQSDDPEVLLRLKGDEQGHAVPSLTDEQRKAINALMAARYKCAIEASVVPLLEANPNGLTVSYAQPGVWAGKDITWPTPVPIGAPSTIQVAVQLKVDVPAGKSIRPVRVLVRDTKGVQGWTWVTQDQLTAHAGKVQLDLTRFTDDSGSAKPSGALVAGEVAGWQDKGVEVHVGKFAIARTEQRVNGRCDVH